MNKAILISALTFLLISSVMVSSGNSSVEMKPNIPIVSPQETVSTIVLSPVEDLPASSTSIKAIFIEPPTSDIIKNDLKGKSVLISGSAHYFYGSELTSVEVIEAIPTVNDGVLVSVKISTDMNVVDRRKLPNLTFHEKITGNMKIHYDKKGQNWQFYTINSVDLQKTTLNVSSPKAQVTRFID